jgi:hypothetical protein
MRRLLMLLCLGLLLAAGCTGKKPRGGNEAIAVTEATVDLTLLEPFALKEKPDAKHNVIQIRDQAKDGDEVLFHGIVPPANVKPWSDSLAVFKLMAKEDLDDPKVKDEFACEEAET